MQHESPQNWLLPYERWFAGRALAVPPDRQSASVAKARLRYGPLGMRFYAAAMLNGAIGFSGCFLTLIVVFASLAWHPLESAAAWVAMAGAGGAFIAISVVRAFQAEWAGRKYRESNVGGQL